MIILWSKFVTRADYSCRLSDVVNVFFQNTLYICVGFMVYEDQIEWHTLTNEPMMKNIQIRKILAIREVYHCKDYLNMQSDLMPTVYSRATNGSLQSKRQRIKLPDWLKTNNEAKAQSYRRLST